MEVKCHLALRLRSHHRSGARSGCLCRQFAPLGPNRLGNGAPPYSIVSSILNVGAHMCRRMPGIPSMDGMEMYNDIDFGCVYII